MDRVWAVHRLFLPSVKQLDNLPDFPQELNCVLPVEEHRIPLTNTVKSKKNFIQTLCQTTIPQFKLLQKQAGFYRTLAKNLLQHDLYQALHGLSPVTESRYKKRALTIPQALLADATHPNKSRFPNRKKRFITAIASALLPAAGKLVTLAVEELGGYLQRKRNKALNKALEQLEFRVDLTQNMMHQLEEDFLLFGEFEINSTESIVKTFQSLDGRTSTLEQWLLGEDKRMTSGYVNHLHGPTLYSHQL